MGFKIVLVFEMQSNTCSISKYTFANKFKVIFSCVQHLLTLTYNILHSLDNFFPHWVTGDIFLDLKDFSLVHPYIFPSFPSFRSSQPLLPQPMDQRTWVLAHLAYSDDLKGWSVACPHGQLASSTLCTATQHHCFFGQKGSVENSYGPVARGYLF